MTAVPVGSDLDHAEQHLFADDSDREAGLDLAALDPPNEFVRAGLDTAALPDRLDQNWIIPYPHDEYRDDDSDDDDHYCLAY